MLLSSLIPTYNRRATLARSGASPSNTRTGTKSGLSLSTIRPREEPSTRTHPPRDGTAGVHGAAGCVDSSAEASDLPGSWGDFVALLVSTSGDAEGEATSRRTQGMRYECRGISEREYDRGLESRGARKSADRIAIAVAGGRNNGSTEEPEGSPALAIGTARALALAVLPCSDATSPAHTDVTAISVAQWNCLEQGELLAKAT